MSVRFFFLHVSLLEMVSIPAEIRRLWWKRGRGGRKGKSLVLLSRGKGRRRQKFIKINGPDTPGGFFESHISRPFQTVNGFWRDPFTFASSLEPFAMIHGERRWLFRTRGLFLAWKRSASSDRRCIQVRLIHWFGFLRSPGLNVSYLFIPTRPYTRPTVFFIL